MSDDTAAMDLDLTGLRNQHAVETQAIGTIQNELGRMKDCPDLYAKTKLERDRSTTQAARLEEGLTR